MHSCFKKVTISFLLFTFITTPAFSQDKENVDILRRMSNAFTSIAERTSPAVVGLRSERTVTRPDSPYEPFDPFGDDFFDRFFRRQSPQRRNQSRSRQLAQGSGFIVSQDGFIISNNHLIGDSEKITVTLNDGREFTAKVIGSDPDSDIAIIKIDAKNLPYLEMGESDSLQVGEWVLAIGNPFGLSHSVTSGIVSAKGRSGVGISTYEDFIQTDAAINPGNSGGPLINLDGKVVGVNTAIISRTGGNMGIGLAIPVNMAKNIYQQLMKTGTVTRGYLGVTIQDMTPALAKSFGLKDNKGVLVPSVVPGSAADKAGIRQGDIIVELEGTPVEKARDLQNRIALLKPGTTAEVVVLREGQRRTFNVELSARPKSEELAAEGRSDILDQLGIVVQNLTPDIAERFGYKNESGVIIAEVDPGSLADLAGVSAGTLITEINRKSIKNTSDLEKALEISKKEGYVLLLLKDNQSTRYLTLTLPQK